MPGRQPDRHVNHPVNYRTGETLLDILDTILDKGLVIDIFVSVSLVGIELLKIEARVIVSSVDTYLRLAEAAARLADEYDRDIIGPLAGAKRDPGLTQTMGNLAGEIGGAKGRAKSQGVVEGVKEAVRGNK